MQVSKDLFWIRLPVAGKGAYGWGPFATQADADKALLLLVNIPGPHMQIGTPRVQKETYMMEDTDAANIVYHNGQFSGGGRAVV